MHKKAVAKIIVFILLFSLIPIPIAAEEFDINAKSAILIDGKSGDVIYEKNSHEKLPPASVTKIMTMLLTMEAIERGDIHLEDKVTISARAESMGGSQLYLETGEQQTVESLLKGIAISSANDACVAMGEFIGGTEELFVASMNKRAKELNMVNTNFVNTNGLPVENHYTTAYDIAIMSRELLKHPTIHNWLTIWMDTLTVGKDGKPKTELGLTNTNRLIKTYPGANGIKTGYTGEAGYCLSASATKNNMTLISVVLGAPTTHVRWNESAKLLDYGFAVYECMTLASKNQVLGTVNVDKGKEEVIHVIPEEEISLLIKKEDRKNITKEINMPEQVKAPIKKGSIIGELVVYRNNEIYKTYPLIAETDIESASILNIYYKLFKSIIY